MKNLRKDKEKIQEECIKKGDLVVLKRDYNVDIQRGLGIVVSHPRVEPSEWGNFMTVDVYWQKEQKVRYIMQDRWGNMDGRGRVEHKQTHDTSQLYKVNGTRESVEANR